jgi:hypothetical protein
LSEGPAATFASVAIGASATCAVGVEGAIRHATGGPGVPLVPGVVLAPLGVVALPLPLLVAGLVPVVPVPCVVLRSAGLLV